jgi:hypothetical protein
MVFENFLLPERTSKYNLVQGQNLMSKRTNQSHSKLNSSTLFRENFDGKVEIIAGKRIYKDGYSPGDNDNAKDIQYSIPKLPGGNKPNDIFKRQEAKLIKDKDDFSKDFDALVDKYSGSAVKAAQEWQKYKDQLQNCSSACFTNFGQGTNKDTDKEKACKVGCNLKGAYIKSCHNNTDSGVVDSIEIDGQNFYTAYANVNQYCNKLALDKKCKGTDAYGENGSVVDDTIDEKAKKGCCECGGGFKGRRITDSTINMSGTDVYKSCSDTKHPDICASQKFYKLTSDKSPDMTQQDASAEKFQETVYSKLINNNSSLKSKMDEMNAKLNKLTLRENALNRAFEEEKEMGGKIGDDNENSLYNNYRRKQEQLEKLIGKFGRKDMMGNTLTDSSLEKNHKLIGINQDLLLRLNSEKMKFAFWSVLALILGIATITSFKKKIE